ncbi:MAG: phosphoglycerate dehydrogenase [Lachnospiraceae bacterium]|nr:phosphoglycerate dehydrogenase [Lachnospiraceae bacterium]
MRKIHCLNPISEKGLRLLTADYVRSDTLEEAEGVLVRSADMHELTLPESLLAVARAGAGVNNIPCDALAERGIPVFNTPGANANGVKELVLAALLLASRDIVGGIEWAKGLTGEGIAKQVEKGKKQFAGCEIRGKSLGVIGLGAIGVEVANAAADLGMTVYGYDPFLSVFGALHMSNFVRYTQNLDEVFAQCDYLTIHVPLLSDTWGFFNMYSIEKMKDGVVILNFARDELTHNSAMHQALASGKVKRYICDFPNEETLAMENCIALPHLGASTEESEDNCAVMAVNELVDYLENGNIHNSVNMPDCDLGQRVKGEKRIAIFHKNIPNMIGQFTSAVASCNVNISHMTNKSKGQIAYTMLDVEAEDTEAIVAILNQIPGAMRIRVLG